METFQKVKAIAKANPDGFTISLLGDELPAQGYVVAKAETQNHFGDEGLQRVIQVAQASTNLVGGWYESHSKQYYYDCVMIITELSEAIRIGKANGQLAIYDLEAKLVIDL